MTATRTSSSPLTRTWLARLADPTTRELLTLIVERAPSLQLLVIATFRPEFEPPWVGQPHVIVTVLNRLGATQGALLVHQVAGDATLAPEIIKGIVSRADGIPLYVEELTRVVVDAAGAGVGSAGANRQPVSQFHHRCMPRCGHGWIVSARLRTSRSRRSTSGRSILSRDMRA